MCNKKTIGFLIFIVLAMPLMAQDIQATRITRDVIVVHGGGANITAVRTDSGIVVIDSFLSLDAAREARHIIRDSFPDIPINI